MRAKHRIQEDIQKTRRRMEEAKARRREANQEVLEAMHKLARLRAELKAIG